ncbi:MAG: dephospho-CoA kinase [Deltaproteobacteria bacterium]|nr:dephospho-CoA kinase [Deltaproteobacteria bacterium]
MERLLRLKSFPVAFKMLENERDLDSIPFIRRPAGKVTLCQMITQVRNFDWTVGADRDDFVSPTCPSILGLTEIPDLNRDGTFRSIVWVKTKADAKRYEAAIPRLPLGKYNAVAMAPLVYNPFEPDIVLIYANPAQMMILINALQFENYEVMNFYCVGESSCSDAIARCYLTTKPSMTIPCYGERRYGHAQDEDLVMAIPASQMEKALKGLEALYRRGIRYPISFAGAEQDLTRAFPGSYGSLGQIEAIRGKDNRFLLGVTGGIAAGTAAVLEMFTKKGASLINYDLLSASVMQADKPAWKDMVTYFGEQILNDDRTINREYLSNIISRDMEKRKKLESFTQPRIFAEFKNRLNAITSINPHAVVLVNAPLMIELNLQYLFHKILVLYTPEDVQIQRFMEWEGISRDDATRRLSGQLSIEEKLGYADFVINDEDLSQNTQNQVDEIWDEILKIQEEQIN